MKASESKAVLESALQTWITRDLTQYKWLWWRDNISRWNRRGYLDLHACSGYAPGWHLIAELKKDDGSLTSAQIEWLLQWQALARKVGEATGLLWVSVYVWRPRDYERAFEIIRSRTPPPYSLLPGEGLEVAPEDLQRIRRQAPEGTRRRPSAKSTKKRELPLSEGSPSSPNVASDKLGWRPPRKPEPPLDPFDPFDQFNSQQGIRPHRP